jgi:RNA-directed DNA polymerase
VAFLASEWNASALARAAAEVTGQVADWQHRLARAVVRRWRVPPLGSQGEVARFVDLRQWPARLLHPSTAPTRMARSQWPVPEIPTVGDLAAWLGLEVPQLEWLADRRGLERVVASEQLRNYRYRWEPKARGFRLLEIPKARLKALQRKVLHGILDAIPAHPAAHGFVEGRSPRTFAAEHAGKAIVLRIDLQDFFATVRAGKVFGVFRTAGYPDEVARLLAALCVNRAPLRLLVGAPFETRRRFGDKHLPQGAPTSPALANLCARGLDVRLAAAAAAVGATYSRYADDLAFSGDEAFARRSRSFTALASGIALDEGFWVNFHKLRAMRRSVRQRIAGIVVNARPSIARADLERLEAILYNCVRNGPERENRAGHLHFRDHLRGRIAWVASVHAVKGTELAELFEKISW